MICLRSVERPGLRPASRREIGDLDRPDGERARIVEQRHRIRRCLDVRALNEGEAWRPGRLGNVVPLQALSEINLQL